MKNKKIVYAWSCDFSSYRGEGILARSYAKDLSIKHNIIIKVKTFDNKFIVEGNNIKTKVVESNKFINFGIIRDYLLPIYGIIYLWLIFLKGKKNIYLNFTPLWNFLVFYLLPPKTLIGPITGFVPKNFSFTFVSLVRLIIIPIFYKISLLIIFFRHKKIILSTDLLKKFFYKKNEKKVIYNYLVYSNLEGKRFINFNRKIDLFIYNRNYSVKEHHKLTKIIQHLLKKNFKIICCGDILKIKGLKNLGIIDRYKLLNYLKNTKLVISSPENPYSLFTLDAINMGANVIFDKQFYNKIFFLKNNINQFIDLNNIDLNFLEKLMLNKKKINYLNIKKINFLKKKFDKFFLNLKI